MRIDHVHCATARLSRSQRSLSNSLRDLSPCRRLLPDLRNTDPPSFSRLKPVITACRSAHHTTLFLEPV